MALKEGNGVTAWSYSRLSDYQQCPARFKRKHIDKLPAPADRAACPCACA